MRAASLLLRRQVVRAGQLRGMLHREPPRRPDPEPPSPPASTRHAAWKYGFVAGTCPSCGTRHLPALQTCMSCGYAGEMDPVRKEYLSRRTALFGKVLRRSNARWH